jgi:hypothetical protein
MDGTGPGGMEMQSRNIEIEEEEYEDDGRNIT